MRDLLFATRHATSLQRRCKPGALDYLWIPESSKGESDFYRLTGLDIAISAGAVPSAASARRSARECLSIILSIGFYSRCGTIYSRCGLFYSCRGIFYSNRGAPPRYKAPHLWLAPCYCSQPIGCKDFCIHLDHPYARPFTGSSPYQRRTIAVPGSLHVRISLAKSEHEATQVRRWYGVGTKQVR